MTKTSYINGYLDPLVDALSPEAAQRVLGVKPEPAAVARVLELGRRCNAGELTEDERDEYAALVNAGDLITILKSKIRQAFVGPDGSFELPSPRTDDLEALSRALNDPDSYGLDESLWPTARAGIDLLLAHMEAAPPLDLTAEEQEAIEQQREASRREQKNFVRKSWSKAEKLF